MVPNITLGKVWYRFYQSLEFKVQIGLVSGDGKYWEDEQVFQVIQ